MSILCGFLNKLLIQYGEKDQYVWYQITLVVILKVFMLAMVYVKMLNFVYGCTN